MHQRTIIITEDDIRRHITIDEIIFAVESSYREYFDEQIATPSRTTLAVRGGEKSCILLSSIHFLKPYYGYKQASSFPSNISQNLPTVFSVFHLHSADTGFPVAIIAANYLTALKTGSASAVATKYLAQQEADNLALIGCGFQARTQLSAILHVRKIADIRLYDAVRSNAEQFGAEIQIANPRINVSVHDNPESCLKNAMIVCTMTTSETPVISAEYLSSGCHINAVGSFTRNMQEIDSATVARADKIVVDESQTAWENAGDLVKPLSEGLISKSVLHAELKDIVGGSKPGRESKSEITLYESLGFAALDLSAAIYVYEKFKKMEALKAIDLFLNK